MTFLTVKIMFFIDFQNWILDKWISEGNDGRGCLCQKMKVYQWVKINTCSSLSTARINKSGLGYFYASHGQFRFLFIIYSFLLPGLNMLTWTNYNFKNFKFQEAVFLINDSIEVKTVFSTQRQLSVNSASTSFGCLGGFRRSTDDFN